jgi:hypothetical protein
MATKRVPKAAPTRIASNALATTIRPVNPRLTAPILDVEAHEDQPIEHL